MQTRKSINKTVQSGALILTVLSSTFLFTPIVKAEDTTTNTTTSTSSQANVTASVTERVNNFKQRAESEIDKRVKSLNELISKIQSAKRLTDGQKTSYTNDVQSQITS